MHQALVPNIFMSCTHPASVHELAMIVLPPQNPDICRHQASVHHTSMFLLPTQNHINTMIGLCTNPRRIKLQWLRYQTQNHVWFMHQNLDALYLLMLLLICSSSSNNGSSSMTSSSQQQQQQQPAATAAAAAPAAAVPAVASSSATSAVFVVSEKRGPQTQTTKIGRCVINMHTHTLFTYK